MLAGNGRRFEKCGIDLRKVADTIIDDGDGHFLLQLRDDKPTIFFPNTLAIIGGQIEEGEEPLAAARRELHEEIQTIPENILFWKKFEWNDLIQEVHRAVVPEWKGKTIPIHEGQRTIWVHYTQLDTQKWNYCAHDKTILIEYMHEFYHSKNQS